MSISQLIWRVALALVAVLLVAEVLVRVFVTSPASSQFSPELEWVYKPHASLFKATEGGARLTLDRFGLNNDPLDTGDAAPRVVVIGDSFTMAAQVPRAVNYVSQLQQLRSCYTFINAGRDAMQPYQFRIMYERIKTDLNPRMVLLAFNKNDVFGIKGGLKAVKQEDGSVQYVPKRYAPRPSRQLLDPVLSQSALMTHLMRRLKAATEDDEEEARVGPRQMPPEKVELLHQLLAEFQREIPVRILFIPFLRYQLDRDVEVIEDTQTAWHALQGVAADLDIPIAAATAGFTEFYQRTGQPPVGFANHVIDAMHMNPNGHRVAARTASQLFTECDQ